MSKSNRKCGLRGGLSPMTKLAVRVLLLGVLGVSTLAAQTTPTADYFSQVPFLQRVLTGTNAVATSSTVLVPFVSTTILVPAGFTALLSARFSAESSCIESGAASSSWCTVRISIGGVEAEPAGGSDFAFDSTDTGTEGFGSWESHSMDRHRCYTNTTGVNQNVPVRVEWGTVNDDGVAPPPTFRIDEWSLVIQESQNCFEIPVPQSAPTEESQVP